MVTLLHMNQKTFNYVSWAAVIGSVLLATLAWGGGINWNIAGINGYQLFPLFGLIAWMTMANHYYLGSVRLLSSSLKRPKLFGKISEYIVLASFLLHPGILAYEQSNNGQGLPPESFYSYRGGGLKLAMILGTVSLLVFLSFEVFNRIKHNKIIAKYWWAISLSQSLAMILIWVHAWRLGSDLGGSWFQIVWLIYGFALIPSFYIIHRSDFADE